MGLSDRVKVRANFGVGGAGFVFQGEDAVGKGVVE